MSWRQWPRLLARHDLSDPPGDLGDARTLAVKSDEYLFDLIKNGGAAIGKPGMPAFGFHLTDEQIRELIRHVRALPRG